ncbi:MAG TPA: thermonuclease family protein [Patescibacteria group bacterium]
MKELRQLKHILSLSLLLVTAVIGLYTQFNQGEIPVLGVKVENEPIIRQDGRESVKVTEVIDGDTIRLEDGRTVRYIGIDTPETKHPTVGQECFGQEASAKNAELVKGKAVELEKDVSQTDRYGRLLRYVWVNGQLVNEVLVAEGYAVASSYPPDVARQEQLRMAEQVARQENKGLWATCPSQSVPE